MYQCTEKEEDIVFSMNKFEQADSESITNTFPTLFNDYEPKSGVGALTPLTTHLITINESKEGSEPPMTLESDELINTPVERKLSSFSQSSVGSSESSIYFTPPSSPSGSVNDCSIGETPNKINVSKILPYSYSKT